MSTQWETFPVELKDGLVSNLSRLQQGVQTPGSARVLENFEPSVKGGYRRINGYTKYSSDFVPVLGESLVQGSGQTGTSLIVANLQETPTTSDVLSIAGVTGSYSVSGVSYSSSTKIATLTLATALDSSPADKAAVTFDNRDGLTEGLHFHSKGDIVFALRDGVLYKSGGSGWTAVSTPNYGSVLVAGASQTGTTLDVDAIDSDTYVPQAGDTFSIAGIELVYRVTANATVSSGASTLSIDPALDSSPADNAAITFLNSSVTGGSRARFTEFNFNGTEKVVMVDGVNAPSVFTETTYTTIQGVADLVGAEHVVEHKDHLFFAKSDLVAVSAPFNEIDYTVANGAVTYRMPSPITGLIVFREELINFSEYHIKKLTGSSSTDWQLTTITDNIGCIEEDTIQEVGGDVMFLGPDGVRFLGATARIGDFNLSLASRQIQTEMKNLIDATGTMCSTIVREKGQYRLFKYSATELEENSVGYIGAQFLDQNAQSIRWGSTKGIQAYRASSSYRSEEEKIIFSNDSGFVYRMENGSSFDGGNILSRYHSPFMSVNDPTFRKTGYKLNTYIDPEGDFEGTLNLKYDFNSPDKIQPNTIVFNGGGDFEEYGEAIYGSSLFGGLPDTVVENQVVGSFFTVSYQYDFDGGPPFILDTLILEYSTEDRK